MSVICKYLKQDRYYMALSSNFVSELKSRSLFFSYTVIQVDNMPHYFWNADFKKQIFRITAVILARFFIINFDK